MHSVQYLFLIERFPPSYPSKAGEKCRITEAHPQALQYVESSNVGYRERLKIACLHLHGTPEDEISGLADTITMVYLEQNGIFVWLPCVVQQPMRDWPWSHGLPRIGPKSNFFSQNYFYWPQLIHPAQPIENRVLSILCHHYFPPVYSFTEQSYMANNWPLITSHCDALFCASEISNGWFLWFIRGQCRNRELKNQRKHWLDSSILRYLNQYIFIMICEISIEF